MMKKPCKCCHESLSLSCFEVFRNRKPDGGYTEGRRGICRSCQYKDRQRKTVATACPSCNAPRAVRKDTFAKTGGLCQGCAQSQRTRKESSLLLVNHPAYQRWIHMRVRCASEEERLKRCYKDRGIAVCQEWADSPRAFLEWADQNGFAPALTLDRIDNDKGYSPDNCRWATVAVQARNTRSNTRILCDGVIYGSSAELAQALGTTSDRVYKALRFGWKCFGKTLTRLDTHATTTPSEAHP